MTPLEKHGALRVRGANLTDEMGERVRLRGMSTHGIAWYPQYVNRECFRFLRDAWHNNCVRVAMYTAERGGYCTDGNRDMLKKLVDKAVRYATELGMYVIVDWHILLDESPLVYQEEALAFFQEMSAHYAQNKNVLYEICNEPNGAGTWEAVTAYAGRVIPAIRRNAPNAVVLVGTPQWSQDVDVAAAAPLPYENLMYTLHFYAGTHKEALREKAARCIEGGLPIFISEFGTCLCTGDGALDYASAKAWTALIQKYGLSTFCWNLGNRDEASSILKPACDKVSAFDEDDLSESGRWVASRFKADSSL